MINHLLYRKDLGSVCGLDLPWEKLTGKSVLISGATGMIGAFLIDVLAEKECEIYALGRSAEKARARFGELMDSPRFHFIRGSIHETLQVQDAVKLDYVIHLASNTHPVAYATDPIGTISANVIGTQNMLEMAAAHGCGRFVFASSNEIYGENRGDTELFREDYCGYIDCNTLRAGYPESKRCGEALCQAYRAQKGLDVVVARFTRSYGPTMLMSDTKAVSQFIRKALDGEDIVLKSEGKQYYSFTYVADAVSGLLTVLLKGKDGEAYNIADEQSDIRLRDLAALIAGEAGKKVIFELPDSVESAGYSKATKARLDSSKLKELGWVSGFPISMGISHTLRILQDLKNNG